MQDEEEVRDEVVSSAALSPGLGEVLRGARTARGLSIEQVAIQLRIEVPQLQALEEERFEAIGPAVFVKGYLRHYCQLLGLDYPQLLGLYERGGVAPEVALQPSRTIKLRNERQVTLWIIAGLVLAAVVVVLFLWWRGDALPLLGRPLTLRSPPAAVHLPG